jgi:lysophospholipase L1-like esterase
MMCKIYSHLCYGGTFSLDGVHLTGRGYAIIANEFIKAINKTYKSNLPEVNPNAYSGVSFP